MGVRVWSVGNERLTSDSSNVEEIDRNKSEENNRQTQLQSPMLFVMGVASQVISSSVSRHSVGSPVRTTTSYVNGTIVGIAHKHLVLDSVAVP